MDYEQQELDWLKRTYGAQDYYDHIVANVEIDRSNPNNSYYMFSKGKVDSVDRSRPVKLVEGASSLPDIDIDFQPSYREEIIQYLKDKYGQDKVCQIVTFGRLQGRSSLKEVLRANDSCSFDEMNKITKPIPDEAAISDLLEEMEDPSIIMWALENCSKDLKDYCWIDENGELQGQYAREFKQAIRLEGTYKSQGKHAAGVIISSEVLSEVIPMVKAARSSELLGGMEMEALGDIGCVKFDILSLSLLDKIFDTVQDINKNTQENQ